jgi:hypothetical protein
MKKILFLILLLVFLGITVNAQEYKTSLGIRIGVPYGLTIKHFLNDYNAVEGILASSYGGFVATGLFENVYWTGKYPALNWYWGIGAHAGFWDAGANKYLNSTYSGSVIGVDGALGLEYTFDKIPLNLSLDVLPSINLFGSTGWGGINVGLSARYVF